MKRRILIVGGVAAGASAATRARRLSPEAEIIIFEKSGYVSFANCGLPYYIGGVIEDREALLLRTPQGFKDRFDIEVRVGHEVKSIDRPYQRILVTNLQTGEDSWESYDRLILASGASAVIPPFPGVDGENVFVLRSMEDTDALKSYIDTHNVQRIAVVGAGFIGLEVAETLAQYGLTVNVVELLPQVLPPLDPDMAAIVALHLCDKGVSLNLGSGVEAFTNRDGRVVGVTLTNGRSFDTDLVLLGVGIRPSTQLAKEAGLALGPSGGICVNERMETSDPTILAAGDAIEVVHAVTGQPALIPLAGPANKHGRLAGEIAAKGEGPPAPRVAATAAVEVFDLVVGVTGLSRKAAQRADLSAEHALIRRGHHTGYYPGAEPMTIKLIYEPKSRRVLGGQIVGGADVARRIDVISTVIHFGGTVDDLAALDLAYAPQLGAAKDPVHIAAFVAANQDRGLIKHVDASEVSSRAKQGYQIVDVRRPDEFMEGAIAGAVNIYVDELRSRANELDPQRPILVYCEVGERGYVAARILAGLGRHDVMNLAGGVIMYDAQERARREFSSG